ncbi:MAG: GNAT family N-acetyltransferase [Candidatus Obscuribacterales bacterium]|nr:GNAT family N-acetyltransferase [Candidatus Obscuribacterales bacterium]
MQLRIGNKQDEGAVRALVQQSMIELGAEYHLDNSEADLKNIEAEYFGNDGIFLVIEEESNIIAFAAARRLNDEICEVRRVFVNKAWRKQGLMLKLFHQIIAFAKRMDYRYLDAITDPRFPVSRSLFDELGFQNMSLALDIEVYRYNLHSS